MRKFIVVFFLMFVTLVINAQSFQKGKVWIGPTIGYGLGFGFGGSFEYGAFNKIGVGVEMAFQSFDETGKYTFFGSNYEWKWKYNMIGGLLAATYHFNNNEAFDPFIRVGVGYFNFDAEYSDNSGTKFKYNDATYTSGLGYTGQIGFRYHFTASTAARISAGWPFYISGGIDFSF